MTSRFPHDPLGRSEPDATERLKAMAEDALAKRHEEAVEREANRARQVLNLKPKTAIMTFRTLGPCIGGIQGGYSVHQILDIDMGPPITSTHVAFVVIAPDGSIECEGSKAECCARADALNADLENDNDNGMKM